MCQLTHINVFIFHLKTDPHDSNIYNKRWTPAEYFYDFL